MNRIVIDVSSEEENAERVNYSNLFDGVSETFDVKSKNSDLLDPVVENEDCDDDCVILDSDPTAEETTIDTCETDEVLVVGQKGEIACRDFPHPRHACAKYSFESTPHQNYCEMCHCYVCDTRAPCPYWFTGFPSIYHCHANDKEQRWKTQRELYRAVNMVPRPVSKPSLTITRSQCVSRPSAVPLPQNSVSPVTQFGFRACSTSTRVTTHPNVYIRPGYRNQQSNSFPQNSGSQPCSAQPLPNFKPRSYNGSPSHQAVSSNPYTLTRCVSRRINRVQHSAQGLQRTPYAPPAVSQGNPQRILTGYISTVPELQNKVYASRCISPANVQTIAVPNQTLNLPVNHQQQQQQKQQSGRSNNKVLLEFEEWLLDDSTLTGSVFPLPGQDDATAFASDVESFLND